MTIINKVTFYWTVEKFWISLPEFVWAIDKGVQSFKKLYQVVMKLNRFLPSTFLQTTYNKVYTSY